MQLQTNNASSAAERFVLAVLHFSAAADVLRAAASTCCQLLKVIDL